MVYISRAGRDSYADALLVSCEQAEVRMEYQMMDEMHPTGRCGVVITDQSRSLCAELGTANHY